MKIQSRAMSLALVASFALTLVFASGSFAADKCDPAAMAMNCQAACMKDSADCAQQCDQLCDGHGKGDCTAECMAKCETACKAKCEDAKVGSGETGMISTASATGKVCTHGATPAAATMANGEKATPAKSESACAKACGAGGSTGDASSKKTCNMAAMAKSK